MFSVFSQANRPTFGLRPLFICATLAGSLAAVPVSADHYKASLTSTSEWMLPATGPVGLEDKSVQFLAANLRNSGILGVAEGVVGAGEAIGWDITIADAGGSDDKIADILSKAVEAAPDALIIGGFDATAHQDLLEDLSAQGTAIVGWHAGPFPGPIAGTPVFCNVTTDPLAVATVAAKHAIAHAHSRVGAVIFTDDRYEIALAKSDEMARVVEACDHCDVLEIVNVRLDETAVRMPVVINELLAKYGDAWTTSLGINDLYFDDAIVAFSLAGVAPSGQIENISAGDGSLTAYQRIRLENYQAATVPEPLNFQGWQLIDELNRAMSDQEPSGFVAPTKLVFAGNVNDEGGHQNIFDPANGYQDAYTGIWFASD